MVKMILFLISGFVSSAAGILTMSRLLLVRWDMMLNSEIDVVIMVLLGGADINGGRGSILGTFIAVILVIILKTGLIVANITSDAQMFVMGLILLVSIIIPNISALMREMKDK
jgi:rhamnose transport system permease protein